MEGRAWVAHFSAPVTTQLNYFNEGCSTEQKRLLYKTIAEGLNREAGVRPEDVFINLVEVKRENWSFGSGVAQYAN